MFVHLYFLNFHLSDESATDAIARNNRGQTTDNFRYEGQLVGWACFISPTSGTTGNNREQPAIVAILDLAQQFTELSSEVDRIGFGNHVTSVVMTILASMSQARLSVNSMAGLDVRNGDNKVG